LTASPRPDFDALLEYVEDELAFSTSHYNDAYLHRRVSARMRRTGVETYAGYRDLLSGDETEAAALLDAFSINVTSFFRNPPMWEQLRDVLRTLAGSRARVRVWSAACSDGREPYSLAMLALDDPDVDAARVSITATDISEAALSTARAGVYHSTRTTDIADELSPLATVDDYVEVDDDRFSVAPSVKRMVDFRRHDLIRDAPLGTFDLVLCRNLFIYIDPEYKEPILATIDASLAPRSYLVIGMAETLPTGVRERYEPVAHRSRIHRRTH